MLAHRLQQTPTHVQKMKRFVSLRERESERGSLPFQLATGLSYSNTIFEYTELKYLVLLHSGLNLTSTSCPYSFQEVSDFFLNTTK